MKSWLIRKDPDAGKDWGQEEKRVKRMRWLDGITDSVDTVVNKFQEIDSEGQCAAVRGVPKRWTWFSDLTTAKIVCSPNEKSFITHLFYFIFPPSLVKVLWQFGEKGSFSCQAKGEPKIFLVIDTICIKTASNKKWK